MNITIYTSPTCQPCRQLKPLLFKAAVDRDWVVEEWNIRERGIPDGVTAVPTVRVAVDYGDGIPQEHAYKQYTGAGVIKDALMLG